MFSYINCINLICNSRKNNGIITHLLLTHRTNTGPTLFIGPHQGLSLPKQLAIDWRDKEKDFTLFMAKCLTTAKQTALHYASRVAHIQAAPRQSKPSVKMKTSTFHT